MENGDNAPRIKKKRLLRKFVDVASDLLILKKCIFENSESTDMADEVKITLPIFDGKDYSTWKKRLLTLLKLKKCHDAATKEKVATDTTWDEKDLKAVNYIYSALSNRQMDLVNDQESAYDIIKKLDSVYLRESTALQICIRNKLEKIKLKDYSESSEFFAEFDKLLINLKDAGAELKEKERLNYLLRTLPSSLCHIGDLIDVLKEEDQTVDFVKNKIKMYEEKEKEESSHGKSRLGNANAFKVEKKNDKACFNCNEVGHFQSECTSPRTFGQSWNTSRGGNSHQWQRGGRGQRNFQNRNFNNGSWNRGRGSTYRGRGGGSWQQQRGRQNGGTQGNSNSNNNYNNNNNVSNVFYTEVQSDFEKNVEVNTCQINKVEWLLDSGCSDHITNNVDLYNNVKNLESPINVKLGDGRIIKATKVGDVICNFIINKHKTVEVNVNNVLYVKEMDRNLISYGKVTNTNKIVSKYNRSKIFNKKGQLMAIAYKENDIYKMFSLIKNKESNMTESEMKCFENNDRDICSLKESTVNMTLKEKYHKILGHVNFNYLSIICQNNLVEGIPEKLENDFLKCATCVENKMANVSFKNNRHKANDLLEIIHTDLNGPHTTGYGGEKYFLTFIDDFSKIGKVFVIKFKSETYSCFVEYINQVETMTGKKIKKLRCDNGREYLNENIFNLVREKGISLDPCPVYVHELNGTAERYNRSVMNTARCLLADSKLNNRFWPEIVKTAVYLKNRTLANTFEKKTPFEIFTGQKPDINYLRIYGSKIFARIPESKRNNKWGKKAVLGILVGYENVGYRVLIKDSMGRLNKVISVRHVDIVEDNEKLVGFSDEGNIDDMNFASENNDNLNEIFTSNELVENENINVTNMTENRILEENIELRRSSRIKNKPDVYRPESYARYVYVNFVSADSPKSFNEAINNSDSESWKEAMDNEIKCLNKNETWEIVKKPKDKKVLDLKWVFTKKTENKYKARLVVKGFQQAEVLEDLYSPVARMQTLKIFLCICVQNGLLINQMDVESAFLNGKVISEVYVKQPPGYEDGSDKVCKLLKALYGLRESPRAWYECLDNYLQSLGFKRSENDYCLYIMDDNNGNNVYIIFHVDDLLIACKNKEKLNKIKSMLSKRFQLKDMGNIKTYLGINIEYDIRQNKMTLDQETYIKSLAREFGIENSKLYSTPMEQNLKCTPAQFASDDLKYRNLIGGLLYISSGTRPDVSFSVNYLSRFQNSYDDNHYKYALRILKYLYLTKSLKLTFENNMSNPIIECFVDADWAGDVVDRRSTTGYVIKMYGNVVYWKSRKQGSVTKSSTAAEYVALSESVSELKLIRDVLHDFGIKFKEPINVYGDNSGAISIAKLGNFTKNSKYIETHYHFVNENYVRGNIDILKVDSESNQADIFTKSLGRVKFEKFRNDLKLK